jgi:hypothetical protein
MNLNVINSWTETNIHNTAAVIYNGADNFLFYKSNQEGAAKIEPISKIPKNNHNTATLHKTFLFFVISAILCIKCGNAPTIVIKLICTPLEIGEKHVQKFDGNWIIGKKNQITSFNTIIFVYGFIWSYLHIKWNSIPILIKLSCNISELCGWQICLIKTWKC